MKYVVGEVADVVKYLSLGLFGTACKIMMRTPELSPICKELIQMSRQPSQLPSYIKGVLRCLLLPTEQVWYYAMLVQEAWYVLIMLFTVHNTV